MRARAIVAAVAMGAAGLCALAAPAYGQGRPLQTSLTGAAEAPGPGDPDASGSARITLNQGQGEVCFKLTWSNVDGTVFAAHVHVAPPGEPGPVVVPLFADVALSGTDSASGCVSGVSPDLIKAIRHSPEDYYINVHSSPMFAGGAIRGQLGG